MDPNEPVFGPVEAFEEGARADEFAALGTRKERVGRPLVVRFARNVRGVLDLASPRDAVWFDVMRELQAVGRPVYVEIDDGNGQITTFLQPREQPVGEIRKLRNGDVEVELLLSHAMHVLPHEHPRFEALLRRLEGARRENAMVWVVETPDTHEILDVK